MEQLTPAGNIAPTGQLHQITQAMKRVKVVVSHDQLNCIARLIMAYLSDLKFDDIDDKAIYFLLYEFYELKLRKKVINRLKPTIGLTISMPLAWALSVMLRELNLSLWPYEASLQQFLIYEIDRQTA